MTREFRKHGFTLVELLVVIAIIGMLVLLLLPAVNAARASARRVHCQNNLKQMGLAINAYAAKLNEFPPGSPGPSLQGLFSYMLPYLDQNSVYQDLDLDGTIHHRHKDRRNPHRYSAIPTYVCPSYPYPAVAIDRKLADYQRGALTTYQGVAGAVVSASREAKRKWTRSQFGVIPDNGMFGFEFSRKPQQVKDGLSNTLAIGEFVHRDHIGGSFKDPPGNVRSWILGANSTYGSYAFKVAELAPNTRIDRIADGVLFNHLPMGSFHPGITFFVIADGSVLGVSDGVDFNAYQAMTTVARGEKKSLLSE